MSRFLSSLIVLLSVVGCSDQPPSQATLPASETETTSPTHLSEPSGHAGNTVVETSSADQEGATPDFAPLTLSPGGPTHAAGHLNTDGGHSDRDAMVATVIERLKPLQVMLGKWRGTTRRDYDGFKAVDSHEWIWDLQSDPEQPSLVLSSDKSPHLKSARITWDAGTPQFLLTATDRNDTTREYTGNYTEDVHEVIGADDKMHRVFRLEFTQTGESAATTGPDTWQIAFAQQENNRYLLEVSKRRGTAPFRRFDTVSTQRDGTSFALDDSDYGEKECIISQGLGTMTVSWQGRTYWVCCSGCKAAFEDDPETWIARAAARD